MDTIYTKKYGIQLLEKWCSTRGSLETRRIDILLPSRKEELLLDIRHEGYSDCVRSLCDAGGTIQKIFAFFIFGFLEVSENIFTPKISGFTVCG